MSEDALWEDGGSIFRPSYSATWLNCLGSLHPSRFARDNAGEDAAIGTVFHWLMAEWQTNGRPDHWLGQIFTVEKEDRSEVFNVECDEEMFHYGQECLDYYADLPGEVFVEAKVDISDLMPIKGQTGTADRFHCSLGLLEMIDWKYGRGVKVYARDNSQELLYCWGVFRRYDPLYHFERFRLHIAQPRLNHFEVWEITRDELIQFSEYARERAHAAWKRNADRTPSPKACQWCKVRTDCAAMEAARQTLADLTFDAIDEPVTEAAMKTVVAMNTPPMRELPDPVKLPTSQLARILTFRKLMEAWFGDIAEELTTRALNGEEMDDLWKIAEGRSRRRWKHEEIAAQKLSLLGLAEEELYERKLVSPNQSEALLKLVGLKPKLIKAFLKTLIDRPPGKPTLVPVGDNRLALPNIVDDTFEAEEEEDEAAL